MNLRYIASLLCLGLLFEGSLGRKFELELLNDLPSVPTGVPTFAPTAPTGTPTSTPTAPTGTPTFAPTSPTGLPTGTPTFAPTSPTGEPTFAPSSSPTTGNSDNISSSNVSSGRLSTPGIIAVAILVPVGFCLLLAAGYATYYFCLKGKKENYEEQRFSEPVVARGPSHEV